MKTCHKLSIIFLKYAPFIAGILMWIHVILKICGIDLLIAVMDKVLSRNLQLVILGTGDWKYENMLKDMLWIF